VSKAEGNLWWRRRKCSAGEIAKTEKSASSRGRSLSPKPLRAGIAFAAASRLVPYRDHDSIVVVQYFFNSPCGAILDPLSSHLSRRLSISGQDEGSVREPADEGPAFCLPTMPIPPLAFPDDAGLFVFPADERFTKLGIEGEGS